MKNEKNSKELRRSPDTSGHVGGKFTPAMDITVLSFNDSSAGIKNIPLIDDLEKEKSDSVMWINITGLADVESLEKLTGIFDIHPLTIEDVLDVKHQPKIETFENYRFISCKSIRREKRFRHTQYKKEQILKLNRRKRGGQTESVEEFLIEQISLIIMNNVLISFQEIQGDSFDDIRRQLLDNVGQIRSMGTEYLAYSLIDAVVNEYYLALAHLEDDIEDFEDRSIKTSDDTFITEIQDTKRYLSQMKRMMLPLRDNLVSISHRSIPQVNDSLKPFFQDLLENLNNAIETMENYREWMLNIMDVNISNLSYQLNKVMKIMAVISSIFIPLTFIAGVYGMNFTHMPELEVPWAYPAVLAFMALIVIMMLLYFKIKHWF